MGYGTYWRNQFDKVEFSLSLDFKGSVSGTDYRGREVLKGIYDLIINNHKPTSFKSMYIGDNYSQYMKCYFETFNKIYSLKNTPSGKVLVKRAFELDLSTIKEQQNVALVEAYWNKLNCDGNN